MVSPVTWRTSYRIVPSRYPAVGIFDATSDPRDLDTIIALESATNPRVLEEAGDLALVRPEDRISGPHTTPVMASFTHTRPTRFSDGSFGVYYAASEEPTAIAETAYHRGVFLRDAGLPDERLDMRVYTAAIRAQCDDLRETASSAALYDPLSYAASSRYGRRLYDRNVVDGIIFRSVRRAGGTCVAIFRPRCVSGAKTHRHLEYRFTDYALTSVIAIEDIRKPL